MVACVKSPITARRIGGLCACALALDKILFVLILISTRRVVLSGRYLAEEMITLFRLSLMIEAIYGRLLLLVISLCVINVLGRFTAVIAFWTYLASFVLSIGMGAVVRGPAYAWLFFGGDSFWQKMWIPDIVAAVVTALALGGYINYLLSKHSSFHA